jgi:5-methylcytosine-specific restriction enzyme subunit McrC
VDSVITLFERQTISYQALGLTANDPLLEILERLNQNSGKELIRLERKGLRATQFVGVIQAGARTIQILPKIDCDPEANAEAIVGSASYERAAVSASQNFLHLLTHARHLKLHNQSLASLSTNRGTWLEMLTRLFAVELLTQLQQGFHQDYVRREDLLPYVRGRWNIARQFSRQPNLTQGLDVSYDDYLPDTLLNRVFRLAVDRLQRVTRDTQNRQILADLESWLQPVHLPAQLSSVDLDHIEFNRLNERFYPAFQLARLLLEGLTVQLLAGGQRAFAFVFDMDRLFEQFVASFLQTYSRLILPEEWRDLPIELQGSISKQHLVLPMPLPEKPMFPLKPDILLGLPGQPNLIIDTKNKALPLKQSYRAVAEGDAYQMLAYATQFHCRSILLLYPHTLGAEVFTPKMLMVEQTSIRIFVATLNLHQPLNQIFPLIQEFRNILYSTFSQVGSPSEVIWPE